MTMRSAGRFGACWTTLAAAIIVVNVAPAGAQTSRVTAAAAVAVDRKFDQADWLGVDPQGRFEFRPKGATPDAPAATEFVAPADLVSWGAPPTPGKGVFIVLVDGTVVAVETVGADAENLQVTTVIVGPREIPLPLVRGVVFPGAGTTAKRDRLLRRLASTNRGDRDLVLTVGDDEIAGTIKSIDFQNVTLDTALGIVVVELTKTAAIVFNPALAAPAPSSGVRTLVGTRDGSIFNCSAIKPNGELLKLIPSALDGASAPAWEPARTDVVYLQTIGGKVTYLSDLTPSGFKHVPYLERQWSYGLDRTICGATLTADGKRYRKGVSMHSTSRLTFPIAPDKKRFAAEIAIDDETQRRGSVTFRVFVDAEERFRSEVVRGGEKPRTIEVDVAGGSQLSLVVDFADFADEQDHADWLNARLMP